MPSDDWLDELKRLSAALNDPRPLRESMPAHGFWTDVLRCVECGAVDDGRRGWTLEIGDDGGLYAFCPGCDEREFRHA